MGWKSTVCLSREKVIELIQYYLEDSTDEELADALEALVSERIREERSDGYTDLNNVFGHNFMVVPKEDSSDDCYITHSDC